MLTVRSLGPPDGPAVVLLHGFLGSGRNLQSLARRLTEAPGGGRCLLVDLPGHGSSPPMHPGAGLAEMAAAVREAVEDQLGDAAFAVIGHSLGGRLGLSLAGVAGARVARLTLLDIAPGPIPPQPEVVHLLDLLRRAPATAPDRATMREFLEAGGLSRALADWLLMNLEPAPGGGVRWRIDRAGMAAGHGRVAAEDLWDLVEDGRAPVALCVRGGASDYVSDAEAARLEAAGARVVTLPGAGHFVHAEALDPLVAALLEPTPAARG